MSEIFKILNFITEIELYSEKCGKKEMQKLNDDYNKDLDKGVRKTKANLWRYVAEDKE
jgi:ribosome recycling factor